MFNNIGLGGLVLIAIVVLVLFGRGRVGGLIAEVGKGVSNFRRGLRDREQATLPPSAPDRPTRREEA